MTNTITLEQLINRTYKALGQSSDAINITADDVIVPKINSVIERVCKGNIKDLFTGQVYNCGDLPFLREKIFYTIIDTTVLTTDSLQGATSLSFDTTNFASTGAIMVDGEVVKYTSKNSTSISGFVLQTGHEIGAKVIQLYNMPTDISNPFTVFRQDESLHEYELVYQDSRYNTDVSYSSYTVVQNNDGDQYFYFGQYVDNSHKIIVNYYVTSPKLSILTDICLIPDTYCYDMIPMLVAGEIAYENEEIDDAQTKLRMGYAKLSEMYSYYNKINKPNRDKFIPERRNFSSIRPFYGSRR